MKNSAVDKQLAQLIKIPLQMTVILMMVTLEDVFTRLTVSHVWQEKSTIPPISSFHGIITEIGMLGPQL